MKILSLDVATTTGYAFATSREASGIVSGKFKTFGASYGEEAWNLGAEITRLIKLHGKPDIAFVEKPYCMSGQPVVSIAKPHALFGAAVGILSGFGIEGKEVTPEEWRKSVFGFSRQKGWKPKDYKAHAKKHCEYLGMDIQSDDEADAICIAMHGFGSQFLRAKIAGVDTQAKKPKKTKQKQFAMEGL